MVTGCGASAVRHLHTETHMSYIVRHSIAIITDASGDFTAYTPNLTGRIHTIRYVKSSYAAGVDFTITVEGTGEAVWTATDQNTTVTYAPRQAVSDLTGGASLYAATFEVLDYIVLADDRLKIVIAQGGDTNVGTFHFLIS